MDEREVDSAEENGVKTLGSRRDRPVTLEPAEELLDLIAPTIVAGAVSQGLTPVGIGRERRFVVRLLCQATPAVRFVGVLPARDRPPAADTRGVRSVPARCGSAISRLVSLTKGSLGCGSWPVRDSARCRIRSPWSGGKRRRHTRSTAARSDRAARASRTPTGLPGRPTRSGQVQAKTATTTNAVGAATSIGANSLWKRSDGIAQPLTLRLSRVAPGLIHAPCRSLGLRYLDLDGDEAARGIAVSGLERSHMGRFLGLRPPERARRRSAPRTSRVVSFGPDNCRSPSAAFP